jgi:hypothetical protein
MIERGDESSQRIDFNLLSVPVTILGASPRLLRDLARLLRRFPDRREEEVPSNGLTYQVDIDHDRGRYRILRDCASVLETPCYAQLLATLEYDIYQQAAARARGCLIIHAGAVVTGDVAIVLPGRSGAGKTTLVGYLVDNGFAYLSDEVAAVDLRTGMLLPFPKPLTIKDDARRLFERVMPRLALSGYGDGPDGDYPRAYALPDAGQAGRSHTGIGLVVFPGYAPGAETRLCYVPGAEAALELIRHSANFEKLGGPALSLVSRIVNRTPCCRLVYSRLDEAHQKINALALQRASVSAASAARCAPGGDGEEPCTGCVGNESVLA